MANKIAKIDAEAMNSLYATELERASGKTAASNSEGAAPQAFDDHKEYIDTVAAVMKEDAKTDFEPNDVTLD
jgi:hypothetical protein